MENTICAKDYSVTQLREWLRQLRLPTSGSKATLASRINEVPICMRGICPVSCPEADDFAESVTDEVELQREDEGLSFVSKQQGNSTGNGSSSAAMVDILRIRREAELLRQEKELLVRENEFLKQFSGVGGCRGTELPRQVSDNPVNVIYETLRGLLPDYDGSGDIDIWVMQLESVKDLYSVNENTMKLLLLGKLKGKAQQWLHSKANFLVESVSQLIKELKDVFGTNCSKLFLRRKFEIRKWKQTESFAEYYNDKIMLANPLKLEEEEFMEYVIDGINDEQLRIQAYLQCYTSKTQLLQAFSKVKQRPVVVKSSNTATFTKANIRCYNCNLMGHYASECQKPKIEKGACYGCGSRVHRVNECPDRNKTVHHVEGDDYFEKAYNAKRLCNWELPKWYPPHPRNHKEATKIIANNNGRLLDSVERKDKNPWGYFRSTYELPRKITRKFADEYNECLIRKYKWRNFPHKKSVCGKKDEPPKCDDKCETVRRIFIPSEQGTGQCAKGLEKKYFDLEYVPGDFTPYEAQHSSRAQLLQQKHERDNNLEPELPLDKLYLGDHLCKLDKSAKPDVTLTRPLPLPLERVSSPRTPPATRVELPLGPPISHADPMPPVQTETSLLPQTAALTDSVGPSLEYFKQKFGYQNPDSPKPQEPNMPLRSITAKPNERSPSPIIPAYANFELAKRMHHDNLDHQPLPDCVVDAAFRKRQMTGEHPGLALDIAPFATGVGIKTHNAGPTHCTKMKVFRPRTCGVVPKAYNGDLTRAITSAQPQKPMTAMDLAIGWDYRPSNPADEPQPPPHIDGSDDTAGPAVFNYVKSPRDEAPKDLGRSAGVFNSTLGESDFFDKDIMRRKTDFGGRKIDRDTDCLCSTDDCVAPTRARSMTRDCAMPTNRLCKQYQSSPNIMADEGYRALRQKYLGGSGGVTGSCEALVPERGCRRSKTHGGAANFFRRARSRLCHKVAPEPPTPHCFHAAPPRAVCRAPPFRVGIPKYDAAGHFISTDSGCSLDVHNASRVLVVPRQRDPYAKRSYDIDTLVPPFRSFGGGAGEGGYPEHWRLASVYQHAYKPIELRRRPLLQTVYK